MWDAARLAEHGDEEAGIEGRPAGQRAALEPETIFKRDQCTLSSETHRSINAPTPACNSG